MSQAQWLLLIASLDEAVLFISSTFISIDKLIM